VLRCVATRNDQTSPVGVAPKPTDNGRYFGCLQKHLATSTDSPSITTPPTRKRQKKADSRVAELERKIDALTATLHAQKGGAPSLPHHGMPEYEATPPATAQPDGLYRFGAINQDWSNKYPEPPPGYGPAQGMQRGPEPKRRKIGDGNSHAVSPPDDFVSPPLT
jgi:hypothetical protein